MKPIMRQPRFAQNKWYFGDHEAHFLTITSNERCNWCKGRIPSHTKNFKVWIEDLKQHFYFHKECCSLRG